MIRWVGKGGLYPWEEILYRTLTQEHILATIAIFGCFLGGREKTIGSRISRGVGSGWL